MKCIKCIALKAQSKGYLKEINSQHRAKKALKEYSKKIIADYEYTYRELKKDIAVLEMKLANLKND